MTNDLPRGVETDEKGKPNIPERFKDANEIRDVCGQMISADRKRATWRAQIEGLIGGNPVVSLATLKKNNMGWYPRVNYREAEGLIQAQQTPFYDLVSEAKPCITIGLDYGKGQQQRDWQLAIADSFTWLMLSRWKGFNFHIPLQQREMLVHGIGCHVWPQLNTWVPRTLRTGGVLFPDDTSVNFEEDGDYFMVRDFLPAHMLYGYIANESAARALGWNPDMVWKVLAQSTKSYGTGDNPEKYQRDLKAGDIGFSATKTSGAWINHIFVREIESGKISHYIVGETVETSDYLFKKRERFDEWPLVMFPYDIGTGDLHSIRGLGARTKDFFELSNRIKNSMAAQVIMGAKMPLKRTGGIDPDKLKLINIGMMSLLPENTELSPMQWPPLGNGPIALSRELQNTLTNNNQAYSTGAPEPTDRESAYSYQVRAQDAAKVSKGAHNLYYDNLGEYYEKTLRMVCSERCRRGNSPASVLAQKFYNRCKKNGVPEEAFKHIEEVEAYRSVGAGSAAARLQALMTLMQVVFPNTTEDKRINLLRAVTTATVGYSMTDEFAPSNNEPDTANYDDSLAVLENDALEQGKEALVARQNNHLRHAQQHLRKASEIEQAVQQGQMHPEAALAGLQAILGHAQEHLQQLENNPTRKAEFEALYKEWQRLAQFMQDLERHVQAAAEQAQEPSPQQQISEDAQVQLAKVQSDAQIKTVKAQHDMALKTRKLQFNERLADAKTAAQISRANTNGRKPAMRR